MTNDDIVASWNFPGGTVQYALVVHVDEDVRKHAGAERDFASAHLGLSRPEMRFYTPETPSELAYRKEYGAVEWLSFKGYEWNGHADRLLKTIGVRADIDPRLALEVAAHEVFHLTQPKGVDFSTWNLMRRCMASGFGMPFSTSTAVSRRCMSMTDIRTAARRSLASPTTPSFSLLEMKAK